MKDVYDAGGWRLHMLRSLIILLIAAPALWGCVSLDQHAALREAYNKLEKDRTPIPAPAATQAAKSEAAKASDELKRVQQEMKDLEAKLQKATQETAEMSAQLDAAKKELAAREKADEDRARQAKEAKPAKGAKPPPKGKKP
jgi:Skp family chaperone for outer membrane proteins